MADGPEKTANKKQVLALVAALNETKTKTASINGEIGKRIRSAVENGHLHAGALKLVAKLARMAELKRADFLRAFELYCDFAKEGALFGEEHEGDLADEAEAEAPPNNGIERLSNIRTLEQPPKRRGRPRKNPLPGAETSGSYKQISA